MEKVSINDWLTIQTRKDLSLLRRSLKYEPLQYGIIADLTFVVLSTCLDNIFYENEQRPTYLWVILCVLTVIVTLGCIIYCFWKNKRKQLDRIMALSVEELVDLFDNEVCYNIMTADSMDDCLLLNAAGEIQDEDASQKEIQKFYFIETCYYLDKAITQLCKFDKSATKAIYRDKDPGIGVSYARFLNVCTLIHDNYNHLIKAAEKDEYKKLINKRIIKKFNNLICQLVENNDFGELKDCKIQLNNSESE